MDPNESTDELLEPFDRWSKSNESYRITHIEAYRNNGGGSATPLTAKVYDAGTRAGRQRWMVEVTDGANTNTGNPAPTYDEALANVHWNEFD